jgi:hypothetical protein
MSFIKYPHLEKFGKEEVQDIEFGVTHIFPKLDGTNASVWLDPNPQPPNDKIGTEWYLVKCGSRNRVLSTDSDNQGFCNAVENSITYIGDFGHSLYNYLLEHPTHILYGEWLVKHTINHYRDDAWRKFYIFDVYDRDTGLFLPYEEYQPILEQYGLTYVPCIKKFKNGSWENFLREAQECRYLLQDGSPPGEGVVIKNYEWRNKYNNQPWAKIVLQEFKDSHVAAMGAGTTENVSNAQKICDIACTQALIEKEYAKIVNDENGWNPRYIPKLLHTVFYCVITEELWDCLKKISMGLVNFKELQQLCIMKVKQTKPELF